MLRIELSALSAQELKRLLDVARERNQAALVDQLRAELDARPTRAEDWRREPSSMGYPAEVEVDPEPAPAQPRHGGVMAATAALAALVSAAVTWGLSMPAPHPEPATAAQTGPLPRAAVVLTSLAPISAPPSLSEAPATPSEVKSAPARPMRLAKATPRPRAKPAKSNACYDLATSAERLVCGYPSLATQDRQLRAAYDRAKAAGADTAALDRSQADWRIASDHVTDRMALATLYDRRIRELDQAAQTAKAQDPPF